jgi:hypothetical protein
MVHGLPPAANWHLFKPLARAIICGRSPCDAKSSWSLAKASFTAGPAPLKKVFHLHTGQIFQFIVDIMIGMRTGEKIAAGKLPVVDVDIGESKADSEWVAGAPAARCCQHRAEAGKHCSTSYHIGRNPCSSSGKTLAAHARRGALSTNSTRGCSGVVDIRDSDGLSGFE